MPRRSAAPTALRRRARWSACSGVFRHRRSTCGRPPTVQPRRRAESSASQMVLGRGDRQALCTQSGRDERTTEHHRLDDPQPGAGAFKRRNDRDVHAPYPTTDFCHPAAHGARTLCRTRSPARSAVDPSDVAASASRNGGVEYAKTRPVMWARSQGRSRIPPARWAPAVDHDEATRTYHAGRVGTAKRETPGR
jgi:hypothetical protein